MPDTAHTPIRVDIVSDVVCPWCTIGYYQLAKAADAAGIELDVNWHPFELNPQMAEAGENLFQHLVGKYGITAEQSQKTRAQMTQLGSDLGFAFNFTDDMFMWNTFKAHQLIDWAEDQGRAHDVKLALFKAHFTNRQNLSDLEVLADVAQSVGLDRDGALTILQDGSHADQVRAKQAFWTKQGIQGVPAMVFSQKYLITGAQGVDGYANILSQLQAMDAA